MDPRLTDFEAYRAMYHFLGELYDTVHNDTLGAVLESLRIRRETGLPVNPWMKDAWTELLHAGRGAGTVSANEGYALMGEFMRKLGTKIEGPGMQEVIAYIALNEHNREVQAAWTGAVQLASEQGGDWE